MRIKLWHQGICINGQLKIKKKQNFMSQWRTLLHIPQSFRTGWLLQKQLITQEVTSFWPNVQTKLELYILSADEIFVVKNLHASKGLFVDTDCLKIGPYVEAIYEGQWYPSLILEFNWDQRDLLELSKRSIYNSGYDKSCFFWPPRDDIYHVPFTHIIGLTEVPNIVERHGQNSYKISGKLSELFNQNLSELLNRKQ